MRSGSPSRARFPEWRSRRQDPKRCGNCRPAAFPTPPSPRCDPPPRRCHGGISCPASAGHPDRETHRQPSPAGNPACAAPASPCGIHPCGHARSGPADRRACPLPSPSPGRPCPAPAAPRWACPWPENTACRRGRRAAAYNRRSRSQCQRSSAGSCWWSSARSRSPGLRPLIWSTSGFSIMSRNCRA